MTYHSHKMPKTDKKFLQKRQNLVILTLGIDLPDSECLAGKASPLDKPQMGGDVAPASSLRVDRGGVQTVAYPELRMTSWNLSEFGRY